MRLCYELTIANIEIYEVMKRLVKKTQIQTNKQVESYFLNHNS